MINSLFFLQASVTSKSKSCSRDSIRGSTSVAVDFLVTVMSMATIVQLAARSSAVVAQQAAEFQAVRAPRVYNALITSDQRLLPSRADPIVAPVFQAVRYYYDWPGLYAGAVQPADRRPENGGVDGPVAAAATGTDEQATPPEENGRVETWQPFVKNNGPAADTLVPDVPPPPIPVSAAGNRDKKKPEEYPPAPVGFAM